MRVPLYHDGITGYILYVKNTFFFHRTLVAVSGKKFNLNWVHSRSLHTDTEGCHMVQISSRLAQTRLSFVTRLPDETSTEAQNRFQDSESRKRVDTAVSHWFSLSHSQLNACNVQELPVNVLMYQWWNVMTCIYFNTVLEYFHFMLISVFYFTTFQI